MSGIIVDATISNTTNQQLDIVVASSSDKNSTLGSSKAIALQEQTLGNLKCSERTGQAMAGEASPQSTAAGSLFEFSQTSSVSSAISSAYEQHPSYSSNDLKFSRRISRDTFSVGRPVSSAPIHSYEYLDFSITAASSIPLNNRSEQISVMNCRIDESGTISNKSKTNAKHEQNDICSICHEILKTDVEELQCQHLFHKRCISKWLIERRKKTCPNCRSIVRNDTEGLSIPQLSAALQSSCMYCFNHLF